MNKENEKFYPEAGTELYLRPHTGDCWCDMVKRPYTVLGPTAEGKLKVQAAKLIFPVFKENPKWTEREREYYAPMVGTRVCFYDTVAESIEPDPNGRVIELVWSRKNGRWQDSNEKYHDFAVFGKYEHQPYLN